MKIIITIVFLIFYFNLFSQEDDNTIKLNLSSRVDVSNNQVNNILKLYENYINSRPDSIYDNPFWNKKEKEKYNDFDFSRSSIFQGGIKPNQLFNIYPPFVLSVNPIGDKYQIRVLFASSTTNPQYIGSKVWCIHKLNAIKEDGKWVLENLIVELTNEWNTRNYDYINYIYPSNYDFNGRDAQKSLSFCENIIKRFNPYYNEQFEFYITNNIDDMGLLQNFDYYFVGVTTGKSVEGKILSGKGKEYYPHEFVHKLLPFNPNRNYILEEGLAEFLGTKIEGGEYIELMKKMAIDIEKDEKINFKSVISRKIQFNGYQTAYPAGAAICELVFAEKGDKGLLKLMLDDTSDYNKILLSIREITNLSENDIIKKWEKILKKYNS